MSEVEYLQTILTGAEEMINPWVRACALYACGMVGYFPFVNEVGENLSSSYPLVRETAVWAMYRIDPNGFEEHVKLMVRLLKANEEDLATSRLSVVKIAILKTMDIFYETPEDALADIVSVLEEEGVKAGEMVIRQGDRGSSMYMIIQGRVRIHHGEKTVAYLGGREIFGEIALLDTEIRTASVTAVEDTRLFRFDQEGFYRVMSDRVEVVRMMIRILCQRLRVRQEIVADRNRVTVRSLMRGRLRAGGW